MEDSRCLRAEYGACQVQTNQLIRILAQQSSQDQQMLEELRVVGSSGRFDETLLKGFQRKIAELQKLLIDAAEDLEKSNRRQRMAEEAHRAAELRSGEALEVLAKQMDDYCIMTVGEEEGHVPCPSARKATGEQKNVSQLAAAAEALVAPKMISLLQSEVGGLKMQLVVLQSSHERESGEAAREHQYLEAALRNAREVEAALKTRNTMALQQAVTDETAKEIELREEAEQRASAAVKHIAEMEDAHRKVMRKKESDTAELRQITTSLTQAAMQVREEGNGVEESLQSAQREAAQLQEQLRQRDVGYHSTQMQLTLREEDLLRTEAECQQLRAMTSRAEEEASELREEAAERHRGVRKQPLSQQSPAQHIPPTELLPESDAAQKSKMAEMAPSFHDVQRLQDELDFLKNELTASDAALRRLQTQMSEAGAVRATELQTGEDSAHRIAQYRERIQYLEDALRDAVPLKEQQRSLDSCRNPKGAATFRCGAEDDQLGLNATSAQD